VEVSGFNRQAAAPIKVEYELTQDGERLKPVVGVMKEFGLWVKGKAPI
jgi:DNA-binding HxlR family transcriptional regulator